MAHDIKTIFASQVLASGITSSGIQIDFENPTPDMVETSDICIGLSRQNRYNGQLRTTYNVAQHSCLVADLVISSKDIWQGRRRTASAIDKTYKYALLHDAAEAYLGDMTKNIKNMIEAQTSIFSDLEDRMDKVIFKKYGMKYPIPCDIKKIVKAADNAAFFIEVNSFATQAQKANGLINLAAQFARQRGVNVEPLWDKKIKSLGQGASRTELQSRLTLAFG